MSRKLTFFIAGNPGVSVTMTEIAGGDLRFDLAVDTSGGRIGDLRGLFFDVTDASLLGGLSASGADVTDDRFASDGVNDLGNGANVNGLRKLKFDGGVEFGDSGIGAGKGDVQTTSFVLSHATTDLTLDMFSHQQFAARLTSVGATGSARSDSSKLIAVAPAAPDARDDLVATDEDTATSGSLLANDTDADGQTLTVTEVSGGAIGSAYAVTTAAGRTGLVTVQSDGTFSFDPDDGFEDLSTGESDTFQLTYRVSDGAGGEDHATVTVRVDGVNDAIVARDDGVVYVEAGDTVLVDVLANDTDVDGTIDPSTLAIFGADAGAALNDGGLLRYTAIDVGGDATDHSIEDALTYTVQDDEGLTSNPGSLTVRVIDPLVETDTAAATAANGQALTVSLETEDRTFNTSSFFKIRLDVGQLNQPNLNVSFVIDESGSISAASFVQERLAVQNTINALRAEFGGTGTSVTVQLVEFATGANAQVFNLFDVALNDISVGTVFATQSGGSTNYEAALDRASSFFSSRAGQENFLLFVSDGQPNAFNFDDEVAELQAFGVSRTAVGFGGGINVATLNQIDNTGGAQVFTDASQLGDAFAASPLFPADLLSFTLTVNGVVVADKNDLIDLGGGDYTLDGTLLALLNGLGDDNHVVATARFDTDNDDLYTAGVDVELIAFTNVNGTDGTNIFGP